MDHRIRRIGQALLAFSIFAAMLGQLLVQPVRAFSGRQAGQNRSSGSEVLPSSPAIVVPTGGSIQNAINAASNGDTILVEPGVYHSGMVFNGKDVTVQSIAGPEYTTVIFDCDNFIKIGPGGAVIGFTLTKSDTSCYVNTLTTVFGTGAQFKGNIFENITVPLIYGDHTSLRVENNIFRHNKCGGTIINILYPSEPVTINNNVFLDNVCQDIWILSRNAEGYSQVINNTFVRNDYVITLTDVSLIFRNNIVAYNVMGLSNGGVEYAYLPIIENNLVYGNYRDYVNYHDPKGTAGNISVDPGFMDKDADDFHLQAGSPALDAGTSTGAPAFDYDGFSRPIDGNNDGIAAVDMGAFERGFSADVHAVYSIFPGGILNYTITLERTLQTGSSTVSITDAVPEFLTYVPDSFHATSGTGGVDNGVLTWSGDLQSTTNVTIGFRGLVNENAQKGKYIINRAELTWDGVALSRPTATKIDIVKVYFPAILRTCPFLYSDRFDDPGSGWPVIDDGNEALKYSNNEYGIYLNQPNWWSGVRANVKAKPAKTASNYTISVDVRDIISYWTASYGLIFGMGENWAYFKTLEIYPNGSWVLWTFDASRSQRWILAQNGQSASIKTGDAKNHLAVVYSNNMAQAYVNGQPLGNPFKDDKDQGYMGITATSYDRSGIVIKFDNFFVSPNSCHMESNLIDILGGSPVTMNAPTTGDPQIMNGPLGHPRLETPGQ